MEADEIARRIRQIHDIETAMDESGEGRTPLTDALRNAIPYMTPEEIREAFYRTLDKVDELYGDRSGLEERLRKEREAHESEIANIKTAHKAELETKDRELAARDNEIASDKAEIADLKKRLAESEAAVRDANHKVASMNQDKFCGASKKGIDKKHNTKKGRDDDKDDFDGTPASASPDNNAGNAEKNQIETISRDKSDIDKEKAATRGNYTLADAQEKVFYPCDLSLVPEGADIIGQSVETVFDEIRILRALQYGMVTYRIKEFYEDKDGNILERWAEHTKHFRRVSIEDSAADGHTAYYYLQVLNIIQICCGAHVWRKIKEWYELTGDPDAKCLLLDLQWLFIQDAQLKEEGAPPEEVLRRRNSADTIDVITRFEARLEVLKTKIESLPKKGRTAVNYALNTQSKLFRWREDADFELDNNFAERAARPVALSRKTSLHNCSHHGAKARAILRSFIETCKLQGIGIVNYMTEYFNAVCGGRTDYENLLPATIWIAR